MFYYESQLKCAMKTDAIYVHHPFAGEKLETPLPLTEYKFQEPPTFSSILPLSVFNDRSLNGTFIQITYETIHVGLFC